MHAEKLANSIEILCTKNVDSYRVGKGNFSQEAGHIKHNSLSGETLYRKNSR